MEFVPAVLYRWMQFSDLRARLNIHCACREFAGELSFTPPATL